jgi:hypothetical protein
MAEQPHKIKVNWGDEVEDAPEPISIPAEEPEGATPTKVAVDWGTEEAPIDTSAFQMAEDAPAKGPEGSEPPPMFDVPGPSVTQTLGRVPELISPLALPAHETMALAMDRPDLAKSAVTMDLKFLTAEAEELRAQWPDPTEIRRRIQAVKAVQEKWQDKDPSMLEDREVKEILYDLEMQKIVMDENQTLLKFSIPSFTVGRLETGFTPPIMYPMPTHGRTLADSEREYLEQHTDPETGVIDPQAQIVVDKVRGLWTEQGLDPEMDDAIDFEIKAGFPMAGADAILQVVTDPLFMFGGAGAARGVQPLTHADELKRVGMTPTLGRETTKLREIIQKQEHLSSRATKLREAAKGTRERAVGQLAHDRRHHD